MFTLTEDISKHYDTQAAVMSPYSKVNVSKQTDTVYPRMIAKIILTPLRMMVYSKLLSLSIYSFEPCIH